MEELGIVEEKKEDVEKSIKTLEKEAKKRVNRVIHMAQLGWGILQGVIRAAGGSITMTTRLAISAGFGAIQMLYPIISAGGIAGLLAGDPLKIAASIAGLAQLVTASAALIAFETQQKDLSLQLRGLNFAFSNMSMMFSGLRL